MAQLKEVMTGPPTTYFVEFKPYAPPAIIDSAFVQIITLESLTGSTSDEALKSSLDVFTGLDGCTGATSGFSTTEVAGKGRVFVGVVGWESFDASEKGKSEFKVADGAMESCRVNFRFPVKGFRGL